MKFSHIIAAACINGIYLTSALPMNNARTGAPAYHNTPPRMASYSRGPWSSPTDTMTPQGPPTRNSANWTVTQRYQNAMAGLDPKEYWKLKRQRYIKRLKAVIEYLEAAEHQAGFTDRTGKLVIHQAIFPGTDNITWDLMKDVGAVPFMTNTGMPRLKVEDQLKWQERFNELNYNEDEDPDAYLFDEYNNLNQ